MGVNSSLHPDFYQSCNCWGWNCSFMVLFLVMVAHRPLLSRPEAVTAHMLPEGSFGGSRTMPPHLTTEPQPPWGRRCPLLPPASRC